MMLLLHGGTKSKLLYRLINKIVLKPVNEAGFFIKFEAEYELEYHKLVLHILCMT